MAGLQLPRLEINQGKVCRVFVRIERLPKALSKTVSRAEKGARATPRDLQGTVRAGGVAHGQNQGCSGAVLEGQQWGGKVG